MERPFVRNSGTIAEPIGYRHLRPQRLTSNKSPQNSIAINYYRKMNEKCISKELYNLILTQQMQTTVCVFRVNITFCIRSSFYYITVYDILKVVFPWKDISVNCKIVLR